MFTNCFLIAVVTCEVPDEVDYATMTFSGTNISDTAVYECDFGFWMPEHEQSSLNCSCQLAPSGVEAVWLPYAMCEGKN